MRQAFLIFFFSASAFAQDMHCQIEEFFEGKTLEQKLEITLNDHDSHGSMEFFKLQHFTPFEGFVAFVKDYAVINLQTPDGSLAMTSQGDILKGEYASLQMLTTSKDTNPAGVLIQCSLKKLD